MLKRIFEVLLMLFEFTQANVTVVFSIFNKMVALVNGIMEFQVLFTTDKKTSSTSTLAKKLFIIHIFQVTFFLLKILLYFVSIQCNI